MDFYKASAEYHRKEPKGKIQVIPTKPVHTQDDLSLAYTPGVAEPCRLIAQDPNLVYEFTTKSNLVAVVSNGSAVLGLGNIGPLAAKPVMEGKAILFKKFSGIDVFDIELDTSDPKEIIRMCEILSPTVGGINLEDIRAPECFYIEEELKKRLSIPVFHDDQHGTAVISSAAFLNALEIVEKKIENVKVVFCGGGSAAIACAKLYLQLGVQKKHLFMADSAGVIYEGRQARMNPYKAHFAAKTSARTLEDIIEGADVFVGVSTKDVLKPHMLKKMNTNPIVFAMANPEAEIDPDLALKTRSDVIIATGRSDYPNQVNNVLGFPAIFRGALDTQAKAINEPMKIAAVYALSKLAKQDTPESVSRAYGGKAFEFGKNYLIPKPFDPRVLVEVASAVAQAAMESGVARKKLDLKQYRETLEARLGPTHHIMRGVKTQVRKATCKNGGASKIVFPEGESLKILQAASQIHEEGIATPILIGEPKKIRNLIQKHELTPLSEVAIFYPPQDTHLKSFAQAFFEKRNRKGITSAQAYQLLLNPTYFGAMMVEKNLAHGLLAGVTQSYPDTLRPALQIIGTKPNSKILGLYMVFAKEKLFWFADTTVNIEPSAEDLADIAIQTADFVHSFLGNPPHVAMLSFSNFGSNQHPLVRKVQKATQIVQQKRPDIHIDGEMQADTALNAEISKENFPFNQVPGDANVLIFPELQSANIAYKLMQRLADAPVIGPLLLGMNKPVFVLQRGANVDEIIHMASITAMEIALFPKKERNKQ